MRFNISTFIFFFLTFALVSLAAPSKRSADVEGILTTLKTQVDSVLPSIKSLIASERVTEAALTPLVGELTTAVNAAKTSLSALSGPVTEDAEDVAEIIAGVISDIATALNGLPAVAGDINLGSILSSLDTALNQVLLGLDILLAGVLNLVSAPLVDVAGILSGLGLTLGGILGGLGL
ncbi:hypothetical protein SISSUDRAFT_1065332 [Sistotremastrum suecicum HHB10207 ss-3]|uniref:Sc15 protein n=1 Tax=Sistotremastrum suecicum HHB10207 ss-3 TaxID=1314776 RepID=A0A165ZLM6_9AGAM|nr:hypothetical protein SISSUDRAFT_1065332 [Sistotremastrum suecicum HHB10207 ss-3]